MKRLIRPIVIIAAVSAIIIFVRWSYTSTEFWNASASSNEMAEYLGLPEEREYPIEIIGIFRGSEGLNGSWGIFGSGKLEGLDPLVVLSLSVEIDDTHYIIDIPMSEVKFSQATGAESTIVFDIRPSDVSDQSLASWSNTTGEFLPSSELLEMSAAQFLDLYFDGATITLSPEEYTELVGP